MRTVSRSRRSLLRMVKSRKPTTSTGLTTISAMLAAAGAWSGNSRTNASRLGPAPSR